MEAKRAPGTGPLRLVELLGAVGLGLRGLGLLLRALELAVDLFFPSSLAVFHAVGQQQKWPATKHFVGMQITKKM